MSVEPSERLKEQLDPEIVTMIHQYNQRNYEISSQRLCGSNEKYDAQLMRKHYAKVNQLYEEERQKLKNDSILSLRTYTVEQEMDISRMEECLEPRMAGQDAAEMDLEAVAEVTPILYAEALRRTELKRDYLFLQKAVKYYRISMLVSGGGGAHTPCSLPLI
jgi:hypothetical protein